MYQIKILGDTEFDEVAKSDPRYQNVNDDNLGFADPQDRVAYVRYTAYPDLNRYLVDHEFSHLLEEHGTDEDEFGIRHKKKKRGFLDWFTGLSTAGLWHPNESATASENKKRDKAQADQQAQQQYLDSLGNVFSQFNTQSEQEKITSQNLPSISDQGLGGGLTSGSLQAPQSAFPQDLLDRIKGFYSGRTTF